MNDSLGRVNWIILILCGLLFLATAQSPAFKKQLVFDYPKTFSLIDQIAGTYGEQGLENPRSMPKSGQQLYAELERTPYWKGFYNYKASSNAPLFEKIRQGEVWRLITPALLHADLLHIAFNMIWLVMIGKQIERRIGSLRYLLFLLIAGITANTAQYLMTGANFLGFSGIVCAMVTFVWARQQAAPWEGYLMQPSTFNFIVFFVLLMLGLQTLSLLLEVTMQKTLPVNIANTAHLAGAAIGYLMGRLNFFATNFKS